MHILRYRIVRMLVVAAAVCSMVSPLQVSAGASERFAAGDLVHTQSPAALEFDRKNANTLEDDDLDTVAEEVLRNLWGTGEERKERLQKAGYDYEAVQDRVNALAAGNKTPDAAPVQPEDTSIQMSRLHFSEKDKTLQSLKYPVPELAGRLGDLGRLCIPDVGIDVAVFYSDVTDNTYNQSLTDAVDSSCFLPTNAALVNSVPIHNDPTIADHFNQGFDGLYNVIPGKTLAYIRYAQGQGTAVFVCSNKFDGHNTEYDITDTNYNSVWNDGYDLIMYTCNNGWRDITVTQWTCIQGDSLRQFRERPL